MSDRAYRFRWDGGRGAGRNLATVGTNSGFGYLFLTFKALVIEAVVGEVKHSRHNLAKMAPPRIIASSGRIQELSQSYSHYTPHGGYNLNKGKAKLCDSDTTKELRGFKMRRVIDNYAILIGEKRRGFKMRRR